MNGHGGPRPNSGGPERMARRPGRGWRGVLHLAPERLGQPPEGPGMTDRPALLTDHHRSEPHGSGDALASEEARLRVRLVAGSELFSRLAALPGVDWHALLAAAQDCGRAAFVAVLAALLGKE